MHHDKACASLEVYFDDKQDVLIACTVGVIVAVHHALHLPQQQMLLHLSAHHSSLLAHSCLMRHSD